ncbi:MAG: hypothetical protein A2Z96_03270 [Spirochaetes bacterium GWB1_48_6]|nr:MAG: hypothetical protein A2Z96_03270 [Spirochaetes bacterium GWB1_48_6]
MEEEKADFLAELGKAVNQYASHLDKNIIPSLRSDLRSMQSLFSTLMKILAKKSLVVEDPYQYDQKFSEVSGIPSDSFTEGEKVTVISIRMGQFESQMEYMNNYYQFSLDFLTLPRLKNITALVKFVKWDGMSPNSNDINTRVVAELLNKGKGGDDPMTTALFNDALKQMGTIQNKVLESIKKIFLYKREEYKLLIRSTILTSLKLAPEEYQGNQENVIRKIKREFSEHMKGHPFVPELITEVLDEEYTNSSDRLKKELLLKLNVGQSLAPKKKEIRDHKQAILEALRLLSLAHTNLDGALRKLKESSSVLEDRAIPMGEKVRTWLFSLIGRKREPLIYYVDILDPSTGAMRQERLNFEDFMTSTLQKSRVLSGLTIKSSTGFVKISQKPEEDILEFYERSFIELSKIIERLNSLDVYFKSEVPKERRPLIKGVKTEIGAIKSCLAVASKAKHEYVAAKEEEDQLKRLGIQH